jgi:hypothetical protein
MFNYFLIWVQHNTTMSTYMSLYNFLTNDCVYLAIIWMEITLWIPEWLNTSLSNQEIRYLWTICSFFLKKSICFIIIIVIIQILTPCFFINIFKIKKIFLRYLHHFQYFWRLLKRIQNSNFFSMHIFKIVDFKKESECVCVAFSFYYLYLSCGK